MSNIVDCAEKFLTENQTSVSVKMDSLIDILEDPRIKIPSYQRPYSWSKKQIEPLLKDLYIKGENSIMILGGIILHQKGEELYIVDGQQRLITFSILKALEDPNFKSSLLNEKFDHSQSIQNIKNNSFFIDSFIKKKGKFPSLKNINLVVVQTNDLDEAFTFFDSQNTRGKKLEDHDILKAHHLRFIKNNELATDCAKDWELLEKDENIGLKFLLETLIARGRKWSVNNNTSPDIKLEFKSQRRQKKELEVHQLNRYQQAALFNSWTYDPVTSKTLEFHFKNMDASFKVGGLAIHKNIFQFIPFQITQTIEGGELFFWFSKKYHQLTEELFSPENKRTSKDFRLLISKLESYHWNKGAHFIYELYIGTLLFYYDKFGYEKLEDFAVQSFYCLYWLRFKQHTVNYQSIYKYVRESFNPFSLIKEGSFPDYILNQCDEFLEDKFRMGTFDISGGFRQHLYNSMYEWESHKNDFKILWQHEKFKQIKKYIHE